MKSMQEVLNELNGRSLEIAAAFFVVQGETARKAYVVMGKIIVAIEKRLPAGKTVYGVLQEAGAKKTDVANGRQLARVWTDFVERGKMSEAVFDSLGFLDAVAINKVAKVYGEDALLALKWSLPAIREMAAAPGPKADGAPPALPSANGAPPAPDSGAPVVETPEGKLSKFEQLCRQLEELGLDILTAGDQAAVDKVHEVLMHAAQAITQAADQVAGE